MTMKRTAALFGLLLLAGPAVWAQGIVDPVVTGDTLTARIELPGGLSADLTIAFEQSVGLTPDAAGLSAEVVNLLDQSILSRLPASVSIPSAFPVLLKIEPPSTGGLSFSGVASVSLHTHLLPFVANSPLRLFKATGGGNFADITEEMGAGSYRARGSSGGFSEFLILVDLRAINTVINGKFNKLEGLLTANQAAIPPAVYSDLSSQLAAARSAYTSGSLVTAISKVESFAATVKTHSGAEIPDVWRSARDLNNVAGTLRAAAGTLRFSLLLKSNSGGSLL
jgi:hypothetical protein